MTTRLAEWASKCGPITKIMQSDGCKRDAVPVAVGQWHNIYESGCHLGNVDDVHYKVLFNGRSQDPQKFLKADRYVFKE